MIRAAILCVLLLTFASNAGAVEPSEVLDDPILESRARALSTHIRCLVCQNQSIDDSDAPLAKDLRVLVRERLQAGESDEKVIEFVADRYGDFVLLRPPVKASTLTLWISPIVILIVGVIFLLMRFRKQEKNMPVKVPPLSSEETKKLEAALGEDKR